MSMTTIRSYFCGPTLSLFTLVVLCVHVPAQADELADLTAENARLQALLVNEQTKNQLAALALAREKQAASDRKDIAASETAEDQSAADREYTRLAALTKAAGTVASPVGIDGTVTISEATTGILLQARSKGPETLKKVVLQLCKEITDVSPEIIGALPIPATAFQAISEAKMRQAQMDSILLEVRDRMSRPQIQALGEEALVFAKSAELLYGSARTAAKFFISDRTIGFANRSRDVLFTGLLGTGCADKFFAPMLQLQAGRIAKDKVDALAGNLDRLESFRKLTAQTRTQYDSKLSKLKDNLAEATKAKDMGKIASAQAALKAHTVIEPELLSAELLATRAGALDYGFGPKAAQTITDLVWLEIDAAIGAKPVMTYELSVQDVQEIKKRWWGTRVKYRTSVELVYQVMDSTGAVRAANGITSTSDSGTL